MNKNNVHCLVIDKSKHLQKTLALMLDDRENQATLDSVEDDFKKIKKHLLRKPTGILFIVNKTKKSEEKYKSLLRKYSSDTILVSPGKHNKPITRDLSGIESCHLSLTDSEFGHVFLSNLLRYSQLKKDFRNCKRLLAITDKRNHSLVNSAREAIAYLHEGSHVHANAAYLSLFDFQSTAELKSRSIWDLIPKESHNLFKKFVKKQEKQLGMQQALLISMQTIDNETIRAGIHIAPTVLHGTRCLQIWVHKIEDPIVEKKPDQNQKSDASPWTELPEKKKLLDEHKELPSNHFGAIDPNEIKLNFQPLTNTETTRISHYMVKLLVDDKKRKELTQKLATSEDTKPSIFWDYMLINELCRELRENHQSTNHLLLTLSADSIREKDFMRFLTKSIKDLPTDHPQLGLLIPQQFYMQHSPYIHKLDAELRKLNASLGVTDVIPDKQSIVHILKTKPAYLAFSSKWLAVLKSPAQQAKLSKLTKLLEDNGILVVLS